MFISKHMQVLREHPNSYFNLMSVANVYWREKNWPEAIEYALRAVEVSPESFYATKVLVSAYGEVDQCDHCYRYAKRLTSLGLPSWQKARIFAWLILPFTVILRGRSLYDRWNERWKLEESSDKVMLSFAENFVSQYENPKSST